MPDGEHPIPILFMLEMRLHKEQLKEEGSGNREDKGRHGDSEELPSVWKGGSSLLERSEERR